MSRVAEVINEVGEGLPEGVQLIAVSKTHPLELVMEAYNAGQRDFGENKVQELSAKAQAAPTDIRWHMIGHMQTNKIKYIAPFIYMIHSVDSDHVLKAIDKEAAKANRTINCLLQVHVAQEETKFGFGAQELMDYLASGAHSAYANVCICGLMGMATHTDDPEQIKNEFAELRQMFLDAKAKFFANNENFSQLSMGMSEDYNIAIEQGSTYIRVGSKIFGERDYTKKN